MTNTQFAVGQVLFREGDPADSVFRLLRGAVDIFRELDGEPILLGTVGAGQFIGEMGVVENRPRSATAQAASDVEVEILTPTAFFDQIASSPPAARELIQRLSQRLREADDRIVNDERRNGRALVNWNNADSQTAGASVSNRISLPRIRGCSASCTPRSRSVICRSSLVGLRSQARSWHPWSRTSNSMTRHHSGYRGTT